MQNAKKSGFLENMSPMQVFVFGIVEGILVLCTIGFFILLSSGFSFDVDDGRQVVKNSPTLAPTAQENPSAGGPTAIDPVDKNNDHIRGNENAEYSIVEFSDLECPFCARFHGTMKQVVAQYGEKVNWVYRHFPLESIHPQARSAAIASECAGEQGKFWEFSDAIFQALENQQPFGKEMYTDIFSSFSGVNQKQFSTCVESAKYNDLVTADIQAASRAGARGTPYSLLVNRDGEVLQVINGAQPLQAVEAAISGIVN